MESSPNSAKFRRISLTSLSLQDFVSPCLKHKKHWNSFTTDYFVPSARVLQEVRDTGRYTPPSAELTKTWLNTPLKCNKCEYLPVNFPDLKRHLENCNKTHKNSPVIND